MWRALLFCLSFYSTLLLAQNTPPSNDLLIEDQVQGQQGSKRLFRIGMTFKKDRKLPLDYRYVRGELIAWQARSPVLMLAMDWQVFRKAQRFLFTFEAGYQEDQFQITSDQLRALHSLISIPIYQETMDYRRWQIAPGIRFEPFPQCAFSPFFASKLLMAYPTNFSYRYESNDPDNPGGPVEVRVKNGLQQSPGWEHSAGLRATIADRFHISLAYYQMVLEQKMTWAWVPYRDFGNTLFAFKNRGVLMSLQYAL